VGTVLDDCRKPFDNLVELTKKKLGGCCTVTVRPEDVTAEHPLQSILNRLANRGQVTVCLMPGVYSLPTSLKLGPEHSHLTLTACHDGVILRAAPGAELNFLHGLIVLNRANNVTLQGLRLELPQVPFVAAGGKLANVDPTATGTITSSLLSD